MRIRILHVTRGTALILALLPFQAAAQTTERSPTQGLKETDRFIKAGGDASQAVATRSCRPRRRSTSTTHSSPSRRRT